ncbi:MAG: hypothetical protein IIB66_06255, partial [Proteobacteria bacterium]|nr:hypothetical protein [Pseudomonadota bacterium]
MGLTLSQEPLADDGTQYVSMEGHLNSLSVFAPFDTGDAMFADLDSSDNDTDDANSDGDTNSDDGGGSGTGGDGGGTGGTGDSDGSGDDTGDDGTTTTSGGGEAGGPCVDTHVDFAYEGQELGTELKPFNTIAEGIEAVMAGGTVWIRPGVTYETFAGIDKPLLLQVWDDPARAPGDNVTIGDVFACGPDADSFDYPDFSSTQGLTAQNSATLAGTNYNLIPFDETESTGAVWTTDKKAVVRGFTVEFSVTALTTGDESDGFSFVVQNDSATPTLKEGGWMGYSTINNCLAVEFDGYV